MLLTPTTTSPVSTLSGTGLVTGLSTYRGAGVQAASVSTAATAVSAVSARCQPSCRATPVHLPSSNRCLVTLPDVPDSRAGGRDSPDLVTLGRAQRFPLGVPRLRAGALAGPLDTVQDHLADAHHIWRHLDALVDRAELEGLLEDQPARPGEALELVAGGGAYVRQLLLPRHVDVEVLGARVLPDDHPLVDVRARLDEERAAVGELQHRVAGDRAGPVGDQRAGVPAADLARPREVALEDGVGDPGAPGLGEEVGAEADEPAGGDHVLDPHPAGAVPAHVLEPALAGGEELGDRAEMLLGGVHRQPLQRLPQGAVG